MAHMLHRCKLRCWYGLRLEYPRAMSTLITLIWPVLLAAPVMALLAADPIMATLTQHFMLATGGFVVAPLPQFFARSGLRQVDGGLWRGDGGRPRNRLATGSARSRARGCPVLCSTDLWRRFAIRGGLCGVSSRGRIISCSQAAYHLIPAAIALGGAPARSVRAPARQQFRTSSQCRTLERRYSHHRG